MATRQRLSFSQQDLQVLEDLFRQRSAFGIRGLRMRSPADEAGEYGDERHHV